MIKWGEGDILFILKEQKKIIFTQQSKLIEKGLWFFMNQASGDSFQLVLLKCIRIMLMRLVAVS